MLFAVVGCGLLVTLGCSDDASSEDSCTLPKEPAYEITSTVLKKSASNDACPTEVPAALDSKSLEEQGSCQQDISDCVIQLECDVMGFAIEGKLAERDGNLVGRVEVTRPIKCVYEVTGKFR